MNFSQKMKTYTIDNLKQEQWTDYNDGNIFVIDNIKKLPLLNTSAFGLESIIIIFCTQGKAELTVNEHKQTLLPGTILVGMPHSFYKEFRQITDDFNPCIIGLSVYSFGTTFYSTKNIWKSLSYLYYNPVIELEEHEIKILMLYYEIATIKMASEESPYSKDIASALLHSVIFELMGIIDKVSGNFVISESSQKDLLFKRFLEYLANSDGRMRLVSEYADKLCVSPKYLSAVIKSISGRNALALIHESATRSIVRELKYSDKSIKEIANYFGFPNISFFGKFVKAQLGVSPKHFRKEG